MNVKYDWQVSSGNTGWAQRSADQEVTVSEAQSQRVMDLARKGERYSNPRHGGERLAFVCKTCTHRRLARCDCHRDARVLAQRQKSVVGHGAHLAQGLNHSMGFGGIVFGFGLATHNMRSRLFNKRSVKMVL